MKLLYLSSLILLLSHASSLEILSESRLCQEYMIPVNVTSQVLIPKYSEFEDNYDVVGFVNDLTRRDSNTTFSPFAGVKNVTASYKIGATICSPSQNSGEDRTLLLASHGLGYDRRYWDSEVDPRNYSFVDFAISQGYSVFFYDRLGTGKSSKVSGYNESQAPTQLAILQQLTTLLRSSKYTGALGTPLKIVHVGHSFGTYLTNALIAATPALSDAAILTGTAYCQSSGPFLEAFGLRITTELAPGRWHGRDNGYLTWVDIFANAATFYYPNSYYKEVLWYTENVKQPLAAIELLTIGALRFNASNFAGPVIVISGEFDLDVCGGDCRGLLDQITKEAYFPNSKDYQGIVHPGVGHGINFSYNATGAYGVMLDYLKKHGL